MKAKIFNLSLPISLLGLFLFVFLAIWPARNEAKEIYLQPSFRINTLYDDNKRLLSDRSASGLDTNVFGVIATAASKLGIRSQIYDVAFDSKFKINRYSGDFDLDSEDVFLDLASSLNVTERSKVGLSANYVMDTSHTSELDVTGLVQENVDREQWSVTPDWTYYLSENQFIQTSYTHSEVSYEDSSISQFFDYTTDVISASFIQQWTPRLQNSISTSAMFFEVPELNRDTTEYSINLGMDYQISETWSTSLSVGTRFTNTEQSDQLVLNNGFPVFVNGAFLTENISDDNQGLIFSFSTDKQFDTGKVGASYSRSTSAQGNGRLLVSDRFSVNYNQKISHYLQFLLNGGINVTTESGNKNDANDRTYYYIKPSIRWLIDRNANITAGYQYRMQEFDENNESATSNSVFINFNYQWDKLSTQEY